jgi:leucyl-tRNA synthetase
LKKLGKDCAQSVIMYRLRDWLVSRQRYWGVPIPVVFRDKNTLGVQKDQLPLLLPEITDVQLLKKSSPLSRIDEFINVLIDGVPHNREADTMDTFMDSSWYFLRFLDP